ncbi:protein phosphatase 2A structural subunit [Thecaphora frezii]
MDNVKQLFTIAILIEELKSDNVTLRLNAIHCISTIALTLGPKRARNELIPFLQDLLDNEDEVLLVLAKELGSGFVEYLGGPSFAHLLLGPLENLAAIEEMVVHEKALELITKIAEVLSEAQVAKYYLPLLNQLTSSDWFTSQTSATLLYAAIYPKASPEVQEQLIKMFAGLCNNDMPMVQCAAARDIGGQTPVLQPQPFAKNLRKELIISDIIPLYQKLSSDDQDSIRLLTVQDLIPIAESLNHEESKNYLLPSIHSAVQDKSWP